MKTLIASIFTVLSMLGAMAQNAVHFDGTNDHIESTYSGVSGTGNRTVEAWVKTGNTTSYQVIACMGLMTVTQRFTLNTQGGKLRIEIGGTGITGTTVIADNTWHHVAVTYNHSASSKYKLYIDGVLELSANLSMGINTASTGNVWIGRRNDGAGSFNGVIDEVRVWNVARSQADIQSAMNTELCSAPNLKMYYKLNQGVAGANNTGVTAVVDNSGNGNSGTLTNSSLSGSSSNWVSGASLTPGAALVGGVDTVVACVPYVMLGGDTVLSSGIYADTATAVSGCDSAYTLDFTALSSSVGALNVNACGQYILPSGAVISQSGAYFDTIPNSAGCDSIISVTATITPNSAYAQSVTSCQSFVSASGNTYSVSGTYLDTVSNAAGCDSVITTYLTIVNNYRDTVITTVCNEFVAPSGAIITASGTYLDTVSTGTPCDSIYLLQIQVLDSSSHTITTSSCDSYFSALGNVYTQSGVYTEVTTNAVGCDSVITLDITINTIDVSVTVNGIELMANASGMQYRWLDCDENYAQIPGGNSQTFTPQQSGNYAVYITDGTCADTSMCTEVLDVSTSTIHSFELTKVFPSPFSEDLWVTGIVIPTNLVIYNQLGQIVYQKSQLAKGVNHLEGVSDWPSGVYYVKLTSSVGQKTFKLIK